MKIAILVFKNCSSWGIGGSVEIINMANQAYSRLNKNYHNKEFFELQLVSAEKKNVSARFNFQIFCDKTIKDDINPDLIIVNGIIGDFKIAVHQNKKMIEWLKMQYSRGVKIASYCTGIIFLAAAGIIDNRYATTHWLAERFVHKNYPDVNLQTYKTIVDEGDIYSCSGSSSFQNLILYLIEKFMGKEYAVYVSKLLLLDFNKDSQTSYSIFDFQKDHKDESIIKVQNLIEEKYFEKLTLEDLSDFVSMSQRNFIRRFKKATGENPGAYIQKVKIESAKKMLEECTHYTIEEIALKIGYEDVSSFRIIFKKFTGLSPSRYKMKFTRNTESILQI